MRLCQCDFEGQKCLIKNERIVISDEKYSGVISKLIVEINYMNKTCRNTCAYWFALKE